MTVKKTRIEIEGMKAILAELDPSKEYVLLVPIEEAEKLSGLGQEQASALKAIVFTDNGKIVEKEEVLKQLEGQDG